MDADSAPLFDIVSTLRERVLANPVPPTAAAKRLSFEAEAATRNGPPASTSLRLKVTLLWSHHLLASKSPSSHSSEFELRVSMLTSHSH